MQNSSKRKTNEFFSLSITLFLIAGIMAILVAVVNNITEPVISELNEKKIQSALTEVLPKAKGFTDIYTDDLGEIVTGAWQSKNDVGICIKVSPKGYGGEIETIVAINQNGEVVNTKIVSMSETSGIGTKITAESFLSQFIGKTVNITTNDPSSDNTVQIISGATKSSRAFLNGVNAALDAASKIQGVEGDE